MSKYIDADRLLAILVKRCEEADNIEAWRGYAMACGDVMNLPAADVTEVVRCKECKHWDKTWTNEWEPDYHYCPMIDGTRKGDFYCTDAERRTSG